MTMKAIKNIEIFNINVFLQLQRAIYEDDLQQQITEACEQDREEAISRGNVITIVESDNQYQLNLALKHIKVDNVNEKDEENYQYLIQKGKILTFLLD